MTTSVTVKARAWGASVQVGDETFELGAHEDRTFNVGAGEELTFTVKQPNEAPQDEPVPGSVENDRLIREVDPAKLDSLAGKDNTTAPKGNMTGATEVASSTDPKRT